MGNPLAILVLGLISVSRLWEGVQCKYELNVLKDVPVQKGLCVAIPCNFTYLYSDFDNTATLYGYWYEDGYVGQGHYAFATNDVKKAIAPGALGRFRLSDKLEEGDCSLFITDAQESDTKRYVFRIEKGNEGYSFRVNKTSVSVTEPPKPEIQIQGKLQAGKPVNLTCTAARCPSKSPVLSWEFMRNISSVLHRFSNGTNVSIFVPNFVPSAADNGQPLACSVTYGSGSAHSVISVGKINLNVSYPPQRLQIRGELIQKNAREKNLTGLSHTEAQEGDTLHLRCVAEGNPSPHVIWLHRLQSKTQQVTSNNQLTLSSMKQQDMGEYTCQARNTEGLNNITFHVYMAHSPKVCSQAENGCWKKDEGFQCNCSICAYPGPEIQWVVDGVTLKGNTSNSTITSLYKMDRTTSILHLKGAWNGHHLFLCHGNSSSGETTLNFFLYNFKESFLKADVVSGVVGAVIMFVIVAIVVLIAVVSRNQKSQRASKPITDPETCTDRSVLVFSGNPYDIKGSDATTPPNQEEAKSVPKEPEKPEKSPNDSYADPQDLYYASIQFSSLKPVPDVISEKDTTEYAEIKTP